MKQFMFLVAAVAGIAQLGSAAPMCTTGSFTSYVALGTGGCMIGGDTFSGFQTVGGIYGATAIAPGSITVTPSGTTANPMIAFSTNASVGAGMLAEAIFNYTFLSTGFTNDTVTLSKTSMTGDGAATAVTNFCLAGQFGPNGVTGCTGTARSDALLGNSSETVQFASRYQASITHDLTLDGGLMGSASGGTVADAFAAPEPATFLLAGLGIALAAGVQLKNRRAAAGKQ